MHILLSGATGFIARGLPTNLREHGHTVSALSRRASLDLPGLDSTHAWDVLAGPPPLAAIEQADAIVHLAGASVIGRWNEAHRKAIRESRVTGTRNLVEAIAQAERRPRVLVAASAIGYYGDRGEATLDERSTNGEDFLGSVCAEWEEASRSAEAYGVRVAQLRIGVVLGPDGGAMGAMLPLFRLGLGGPLGSGRQWWSWVHRDDVQGLIIECLQNEALIGPVNATAPTPVRQRDFAAALGNVLSRPAFLPAPAFALRLVLGGFASELLTSKRVLPARAEAAGYRFRYPELSAALAAAV